MTTVKKLIEELSKLDPDTVVFIPGYEGGYKYASTDLDVYNFNLGVNSEWYYGPHQLADNGPVKGVIL
jgi:hypothetical protein